MGIFDQLLGSFLRFSIKLGTMNSVLTKGSVCIICRCVLHTSLDHAQCPVMSGLHLMNNISGLLMEIFHCTYTSTDWNKNIILTTEHGLGCRYFEACWSHPYNKFKFTSTDKCCKHNIMQYAQEQFASTCI